MATMRYADRRRNAVGNATILVSEVLGADSWEAAERLVLPRYQRAEIHWAIRMLGGPRMPTHATRAVLIARLRGRYRELTQTTDDPPARQVLEESSSICTA